MAVKIAIVDDHDIIRAGIKSVLEKHAQYKVCVEAADAQAALKAVEEFKPEIVLLDISMPKLSGLDIITRIKRINPQGKIIIISVYKLGAYISKALRSGVNGYINKDSVAEELIPALSSVCAGNSYFGSAISNYLTQVMQEPRKKEVLIGKILNEREQDILRLTAEGKTAKEIAEIVFLSRRTVENYKNGILKKLNLHKTSDLIRYAIEHKIVDADE